MQSIVCTNKKLISLLCTTIILAIGLVAPVHAADAPAGNPPKVVEAIVIPPVTPFKDVPNDAPYVHAVQYLYEAGISCGTSTETFSPGRAVSLAEMATMLCRAYYPAMQMTMDQAAALLAPGTPRDSPGLLGVGYQHVVYLPRRTGRCCRTESGGHCAGFAGHPG